MVLVKNSDVVCINVRAAYQEAYGVYSIFDNEKFDHLIKALSSIFLHHKGTVSSSCKEKAIHAVNL